MTLLIRQTTSPFPCYSYDTFPSVFGTHRSCFTGGDIEFIDDDRDLDQVIRYVLEAQD